MDLQFVWLWEVTAEEYCQALNRVRVQLDAVSQSLQGYDGSVAGAQALLDAKKCAYDEASSFSFAALCRDTASFVAQCGFFNINTFNRSCEIGYWVDPLHQGRGVATECLRQMTDLAFGLVTARELLGNKSEEETELFPVEMNKCRLFIRPENAASQALARKVGYVHEATLRDEYSLRGVLSDAELFTKLRREHLPVRSEDTREEADGAS